MNAEDRTYIRTAIYMAMGALKALATDQSRVEEVVRQLGVAANKLDKRQSGKAIGGHARAESLSPQRRKEIAAAAANHRWNPQNKTKESKPSGS